MWGIAFALHVENLFDPCHHKRSPKTHQVNMSTEPIISPEHSLVLRG